MIWVIVPAQVNPQLETRNPNPKPLTPKRSQGDSSDEEDLTPEEKREKKTVFNPKPQTLNPKPGTLKSKP